MHEFPPSADADNQPLRPAINHATKVRKKLGVNIVEGSRRKTFDYFFKAECGNGASHVRHSLRAPASKHRTEDACEVLARFRESRRSRLIVCWFGSNTFVDFLFSKRLGITDLFQRTSLVTNIPIRRERRDSRKAS